MQNQDTTLTLAVQKSGRLADKTMELLKESGISFGNGHKSTLRSMALNFPLQILFLRDDDIPDCIADGTADAGIAGENIFLERQLPLDLMEKLGFGRCRMSLAFPRSFSYSGPQDLQGLKIATSYPGILSNYFKSKQVDASIHKIHGSVEITPSVGISDGIFDIVSTGSTLAGNGLKEVETILESEAVLMASPNLSSEKRTIMERLLFRIQAVNKSKNHKYILLNCPNSAVDAITDILPGMKSPTVMPLKQDGWSSLHSVIREDDFWENIDALRAAGAEGILVIPIEKMIG